MKISKRTESLREIVGYLKEIPELGRKARENVIRNNYLISSDVTTTLAELILVGKANRHHKRYGYVPPELEPYNLGHHSIITANNLRNKLKIPSNLPK